MGRSLALLVLVTACDGGGSNVDPVDAPVVYPYKFGFVGITGKPAAATWVSAGFGTSASPMVSTARTASPADGACREVSYPSGKGTSFVDFGTLTVRSASGLEVVLDAAHRSDTFSSSLAEHETITMSSTGADVPAFTATIELPDKLVVTAPAQLAPSTSWDGIVRWEPIADDVVVRFSRPPQYHTDAHSTICRYPGSAGTGTLLTVSGGGSLSVYTEARMLGTAGDYPLELSATYVALYGDTMYASP